MRNVAILIVALTATVPSHLDAQVLHTAADAYGRITECAAQESFDSLPLCAWSTAANVASQGRTDARSEGTAVALSVLPGLIGVQGAGSYYAGNSRHGTRHLIIGLGSLGALIAGISSCDSGLGVPSIREGGCGGASTALTAVGALGYLFNWGWSTLVAVHDVRDYNERRRQAVSWRVAPRVELSEKPGATLGSDRGPARLSLRILRLAF